MTQDKSKEKNPNDETMEEPENALPEATFAELPESMQAAAKRAGWTALMPVQAKSIPYILEKRDLMVQSRTGSGKTGAFMLPIIERIDPERSECQALILAPTRELAKQVEDEAGRLAGDSGVRTVAVYGGVGYGPQLDAFKKGAHIVVGTPGRVLDHLIQRNLKLDGLNILVLDEADRMLSMGFYPDMVRVREFLPKSGVNGYMFSATFPPQVVRLARRFLSDPETLSLSRDHVHVTEVEHVYYNIPGMDKDRALVRIIEIENPVAGLIFCNTKANVHYVATVLQRFGYDADEISSDLSQGAREKVLTRVRKGSLRFLVATDVAARGLDIPELTHVFQYEPPEDLESYIHRAGRTGRAGASGEAISLISGIELVELRRIGKRYKIEFEERPVPSDEDVAKVVSERLTAMLEAERREKDNLVVERMRRFVPLARGLGEDDDELDLIAMLLDDYYQKSLHSPPAPVVSAEKVAQEPPATKGKSAEGSSGGNRGKGRRRSGSGRRTKRS